MRETFAILFDTAIGRCGLAWAGSGILAASFPEADDERTLARLRRRAPDARQVHHAPADIERTVAVIRALAKGEAAGFYDARLDLDGVGAFERGVYAATSRIGPGETRTYGEIARELGDVSLSRRVGQALGANPIPIVIPCHRVVGAGGAMTGFSAPGGTEMKRRLLKIEGAIGPDLFDFMDG
ncbi:methylated-DNA--[protein]-cysteine S-methyltransferase [Oricola sp.]|uniref:methylated-DNA--[protein]-cysteine S-methyltransferase n=1 Tax=Oricola sp. TaxID=1979950 RepID=UPI0025FCA81B|nr:methylated-DNA--[protein]-cysteine S-methyltransferase [Oricola sp.]MCI5078497.1 methylated-DNA--[protein]-cysteine S-methyltransferase [Oricola sp.]